MMQTIHRRVQGNALYSETQTDLTSVSWSAPQRRTAAWQYPAPVAGGTSWRTARIHLRCELKDILTQTPAMTRCLVDSKLEIVSN